MKPANARQKREKAHKHRQMKGAAARADQLAERVIIYSGSPSTADVGARSSARPGSCLLACPIVPVTAPILSGTPTPVLPSLHQSPVEENLCISSHPFALIPLVITSIPVIPAPMLLNEERRPMVAREFARRLEGGPPNEDVGNQLRKPLHAVVPQRHGIRSSLPISRSNL